MIDLREWSFGSWNPNVVGGVSLFVHNSCVLFSFLSLYPAFAFSLSARL